jgi:hypothetical protein
MFAVCEPLHPQMLAITHQQIEGEKTEFTSMEEQIVDCGRRRLSRHTTSPSKTVLPACGTPQSFAKGIDDEDL